MKFSMPKGVFNDEMEGKLIELWAHYQREKSGTMKKRLQKEKKIAEELNLYARSVGLDMTFDGKMVHNKIDNLKAKSKELYRKFRKTTSTGSPAPGPDDAIDLEGAYAGWANFKKWHKLFKDVPGFGPLTSTSSLSVAAASSSSSASSRSTSPIIDSESSTGLVESANVAASWGATTPHDRHRSSPSSSAAVSIPVTPSSTGQASQPTTPRVSRPPLRLTGDDSDDDFVGDVVTVTDSEQLATTPATPTYQPG
eukprot:scpid40822/ scgid28619/ 